MTDSSATLQESPAAEWSLGKLLAETQRLAALGSWEWEVATNKVTWSDELYRIYDLQPQAFPATFEAYLARVHPDDRPMMRETVEKAFRDCTSFDRQERIVRSDGEVRVLRSQGRAIPDASGRTIRMVGTCQDITESTQVEEALRESEERFREIAENIADVFWVVSPDLRKMFYLSPAFESVFGVPRRELEAQPKNWLKLIHPEDRDRVRASVNEQTAEGRIDVTARLLRPDAAKRWVRFRGYPIRNKAGRILRIAGITEDITELKQTEEALRLAQQRLEEAYDRSQDRVVLLEEQMRTRTSFVSFVGKSAPMQEVYRRLRLAAQSDVTVLLTGESGTGKELAAAAIHALSARRTRPFVGVNCSAIPEALLESELFGHVKGAFTGAIRDKVGLFQAAEGGTLFLDEVGDMSPALQVKVLRALQEREIRRVGDERVHKVDVRVVTATNRDLQQLISSGKLREDFYYRIRVFDIEMPPLRKRSADIPLLIGQFLNELGSRGQNRVTGIAPDALRALMEYAWPGNVRELRNAIEHGLVMASTGALTLGDLPGEIRNREATSAWSPEELAERERLRDALKATGGNRTRAAAVLGFSRVTLWKKLRRFSLEKDEPPAFPVN